jgi:hypothetical protein
MSRGALKITEREVTRALKGAAKAGVNVSRVEIDKKAGKLTLFTGADVSLDDLDRELAEFEAKL